LRTKKLFADKNFRVNFTLSRNLLAEGELGSAVPIPFLNRELLIFRAEKLSVNPQMDVCIGPSCMWSLLFFVER
jgi:hypothetical protein